MVHVHVHQKLISEIKFKMENSTCRYCILCLFKHNMLNIYKFFKFFNFHVFNLLYSLKHLRGSIVYLSLKFDGDQ